jgi:hypothetical protein
VEITSGRRGKTNTCFHGLILTTDGHG